MVNRSLAFVVIFLIYDAAAQSCGKSYYTNRFASTLTNISTARIVGGVEARPHSIPFIASLQVDGWPFCGGTLIRCSNTKEESNLVITAAHCVYGGGISGLQVNFGEHSFYTTETGQKSIAVKAFETHSAYNEETTLNDIAVVQLSTPVPFSNTIQPSCLPEAGEKLPAVGTNCLVAGWGLTTESGYDGSSVLMQVMAPIMSDIDCATPAYYGSSFNNAAMFCAGYKEGLKDSCQGDSGGPHLCYKNNAATLYGVVSFGEGCARAYKPGVYTRVVNYLPWIDSMKLKYCSV